eukprot:5247751-Amphidinium_carterae.1
MSYNVLARPYTTYNTMHHRAPSRIEDKVQTITRYTLAGETILSSGSDVVLLQECEGAFFKSDWNAAAERLAQQYTVFLCGEGAGSFPRLRSRPLRGLEVSLVFGRFGTLEALFAW